MAQERMKEVSMLEQKLELYEEVVQLNQQKTTELEQTIKSYEVQLTNLQRNNQEKEQEKLLFYNKMLEYQKVSSTSNHY